MNDTLGSGGSLQISRDGNSTVATGMITDCWRTQHEFNCSAFGVRTGSNLHASLPTVLSSSDHEIDCHCLYHQSIVEENHAYDPKIHFQPPVDDEIY